MTPKNEAWKFKTARPGRWIWQRLSVRGDLLSQSELDFPSIEECAVDAQRLGYSGVIAAYAATD